MSKRGFKPSWDGRFQVEAARGGAIDSPGFYLLRSGLKRREQEEDGQVDAPRYEGILQMSQTQIVVDNDEVRRWTESRQARLSVEKAPEGHGDERFIDFAERGGDGHG